MYIQVENTKHSLNDKEIIVNGSVDSREKKNLRFSIYTDNYINCSCVHCFIVKKLSR